MTDFIAVFLDDVASGIEPEEERMRIRQKMDFQLEVKCNFTYERD